MASTGILITNFVINNFRRYEQIADERGPQSVPLRLHARLMQQRLFQCAWTVCHRRHPTSVRAGSPGAVRVSCAHWYVVTPYIIGAQHRFVAPLNFLAFGFCGVKPQRARCKPIPYNVSVKPHRCRINSRTACRVYNANNIFSWPGIWSCNSVRISASYYSLMAWLGFTALPLGLSHNLAAPSRVWRLQISHTPVRDRFVCSEISL
ncbi:MAG: hypothetical protein E5299_00484 [Burkholderia gladioli]|nr:MAG: hypothetical protein E5299_00484 [Burkholderia gladioli]